MVHNADNLGYNRRHAELSQAKESKNSVMYEQ